MSDLTVPIDAATEATLNELAVTRRQSKDAIAAEALAAFARREADIMRKIKRGQDDVSAGRTISHDEVMRRAAQIIESAQQLRK